MVITVTSEGPLRTDDLGFPTVEWWEHRGKEEIWCTAFITVGPNNELYFASDGGVMGQPIYRMRPWERLVGFRVARATEIYNSNADKRIQDELKGQHLFFRLALANDAVVMLADVADDYGSIPMHLSYGTGSPVGIAELHSALHKHFILRRQSVIDELCDGDYRVPNTMDPYRLLSEQRLRSIKAATMADIAKRSGFWGKLFK